MKINDEKNIEYLFKKISHINLTVLSEILLKKKCTCLDFNLSIIFQLLNSIFIIFLIKLKIINWSRCCIGLSMNSLLSKFPLPKDAGSPSRTWANASSSAESSVSPVFPARIYREKESFEETRFEVDQRPVVGNLSNRWNSPDIGMCIEHGAYKSSSRSWHATDEN